MTFSCSARKGRFGRAQGGLVILVVVNRSLTFKVIGQECQGILAFKCISLGSAKGEERRSEKNTILKSLLIINFNWEWTKYNNWAF